jgi:hypothetical protein
MTDKPKNESRQKFEAFKLQQGWLQTDFERDAGGYLRPELRTAWKDWQAGYAAALGRAVQRVEDFKQPVIADAVRALAKEVRQ